MNGFKIADSLVSNADINLTLEGEDFPEVFYRFQIVCSIKRSPWSFTKISQEPMFGVLFWYKVGISKTCMVPSAGRSILA